MCVDTSKTVKFTTVYCPNCDVSFCLGNCFERYHIVEDAKWCHHGNQCHWFLCDRTMLTNPNPLVRNAEWCRYCNHLRTLNLSYFKMAKAMQLKIIASRSPSLAYHILWKFTNQIKSLGVTHRQTGWRYDEPTCHPTIDTLSSSYSESVVK
jgi:hypothetical protein